MVVRSTPYNCHPEGDIKKANSRRRQLAVKSTNILDILVLIDTKGFRPYRLPGSTREGAQRTTQVRPVAGWPVARVEMTESQKNTHIRNKYV